MGSATEVTRIKQWLRDGESSTLTYSQRSPSLTENSLQRLESSYSGFAVDGRASIDTYASTVDSADDPRKFSRVQYDHSSEIIPSNPPSFAELFPSTRRLLIQHDDTTADRDMNLRVHTWPSESPARECGVILFHLRIYDLQDRKFSLRRYCRESGREVCRSSLKRRSPSSASGREAPLPTPRFHPPSPNSAAAPPSRGEDTTYPSSAESSNSRFTENIYWDKSAPDSAPPRHTNILQLEFSNYARVDVKKRGSKTLRQYHFEYWGTKYHWKRCVQKRGRYPEIIYCLYQAKKPKPIAYIIPQTLTSTDRQGDEVDQFRVPPCSMWINDSSVFSKMTDVADVIVATGLIALVDACIVQSDNCRDSSSESLFSGFTPFMRSIDLTSLARRMGRLIRRPNPLIPRLSKPLRHISTGS